MTKLEIKDRTHASFGEITVDILTVRYGRGKRDGFLIEKAGAPVAFVWNAAEAADVITQILMEEP